MWVAQSENIVALWYRLLDYAIHTKITMKKRYQYYTKEGIKWTPWFQYEGSQEPWQLKGKLKNEYR